MAGLDGISPQIPAPERSAQLGQLEGTEIPVNVGTQSVPKPPEVATISPVENPALVQGATAAVEATETPSASVVGDTVEAPATPPAITPDLLGQHENLEGAVGFQDSSVVEPTPVSTPTPPPFAATLTTRPAETYPSQTLEPPLPPQEISAAEDPLIAATRNFEAIKPSEEEADLEQDIDRLFARAKELRPSLQDYNVVMDQLYSTFDKLSAIRKTRITAQKTPESNSGLTG